MAAANAVKDWGSPPSPGLLDLVRGDMGQVSYWFFALEVKWFLAAAIAKLLPYWFLALEVIGFLHLFALTIMKL